MISGTRRWINPWIGATERRRSVWRRMTPPQLFVGSFLTLIVMGTLGLKLLPGLYTGEPLGWIDALFTATSAVCITGLIVVDTATYFTVWGQAFLLLLIQLGGLGMITFTTLIILALGRRLSLRHEAITRAGAEIAPLVDTERLARSVVLFTLRLEAIGALILYLLWVPKLGWAGAAWPAVFHTISAFCNAGFSTFSDSLVGYNSSAATLWLMMLLIVAGGIGFLTIEELGIWRRERSRGRAVRLSSHSRLVVTVSGTLLATGAVAFAFFEWNGLLREMSVMDRLSNAIFMSVTPRSSGFNTVDYSVASESTNFFTILLMFIGGSPGSTAGGIKTTTLGVLALLAWTRFRGRDIVSVWGRSIPEDTIQRAVGLAVVAFGLVTASIFVFTFTEGAHGVADPGGPGGFLGRMFEAASAFNTVGLSMGLTPTLSDTGRLVTTLLMFVGRVGPLTFAAAIAVAAQRQKVSYRYAYEDVVIG